MTLRPKHLRQSTWDAIDAKYADIDHPEWTTTMRLPNKFWLDEHNHRRYIQWLGKELKIKQLDDWYQVRSSDLMSRRGSGILEYYDHSHIRFIMAMYPRHDWKMWRFTQVPSRYWNDLENVKAYVRWFEKQFGIRKKSDWHRVQQGDIYQYDGCGLMDHYQCSVVRLLKAVYPKHDWQPWLFTQVVKNFWTKRSNRIVYLKWLERKLRIKKPDDWYRVTKTDFADNHGASLLITPGLSRLELLRELYPKHVWLEWKFKQVSPGYWEEPENRLRYLKWLGKQLKYKNKDDWYRIKRQDFVNHYGGTMIDFAYQGDLTAPLKELYPGTTWQAWKFFQVPNGYWDSRENCRDYLQWLAKQLGYRTHQDWYQVSRHDFWANLGHGFLKRFKTPYKGLAFAYPDVEWLPWLFDYAPSGFWHDPKNRAWYLRWLGKELRYTRPTDWQTLTAEQLRKHKGSNGLLMKLKLVDIRKAGERAGSKNTPLRKPKK